VFSQPHDGGRGSAPPVSGNQPLPMTLFAVTPPALTTPTQPPAIAMSPPSSLRALDANGVARHHFSTAPSSSTPSRSRPTFFIVDARSLYPTRPDECNGLIYATIIIGEQGASINHDGKLKLIEYLMIFDNFLYLYDVIITRTTISASALSSHPPSPPVTMSLSILSLNNQLLYLSALASVQASGIVAILLAVASWRVYFILHNQQQKVSTLPAPSSITPSRMRQ
jgi:hypothetical protein